MTKRDYSRYVGLGITQYGNIDEFLRDPNPGGPMTIDYNGSPLDILIRRKEGAKTTMVLFHPAVTSEAATRPYFVGFGLTDKLRVNAVFIADPSLEMNDDLRIGWFAGNAKQPLQQDLPTILRHLLSSLGTKSTIFYGASAGGFAALYYSAQFPGSIAMPVNPQTSITEYFDYLYQPYAMSCWGAATQSAAKGALESSTVSDLRNVYRNWPGNTVLYVQNESDWHVEKHMLPFFESVPRNNNLYRLLGNWGDGHVPPSPAVQVEILAKVVESAGDWTYLRHEPCQTLAGLVT